MPNIIYFAHPMNTYANHPLNTDNNRIETILIRHYIHLVFPHFAIENPNQKKHQDGAKEYQEKFGNPMKYFYDQVLPNMTAGICLPFKDGMFGAGVFGEAEWLDNHDKPIYEIDYRGKIKVLVLDPIRKLSIDDTVKRIHNPY